jgi:cell division protein FtsI (penicillin-binding protein 3)
VALRGQKARSRARLFVFVTILGAIACALVVQLVRLTVVLPSREGGEPITLPEVQRGSILDRNGRILAVTTRVQRVVAWTPFVTDAAETASLLAGILGMDERTVGDLLRAHGSYAVIKRRISETEAAEVARLQAQRKLAGIKVESYLGRLYPQGRLASHLVGWVGADNVPLGGIEFSLNDELAPQPVRTDTETVYGDQIYLTIDLDVQAIVDRVARAAMEANKPDSLTILVMDAPTGEMLAWTSLPDFDPNELNRGTPIVDPFTTSNRPVTAAYEPGSVFKIFSLTGLLDRGAIEPTDTFDASRPYEKVFPSGETLTIRDVGVHGMLTPQEIIEYSSNVGAAHASDQADAKSFSQMIAKFGFGKQTGVPLQGETDGILPDVSRWSGRTKATMVFGQEISVSAIQIMQAATAIANGGLLLRPLIVKKIVSPQGSILKEFSREPLWEVVSPDAARSMLAWMETATSSAGTARRAAIEGVRISAKTGTAQVVDPATGKYSPTDFIASLIGIFPTDRPRYIIYVVLSNPKGQSYYGSQIAAPVFHDVALGIIDEVGIPRAATISGTLPGAVDVPAARPIVVGSAMPDLTGTPKKLLLPLLLRRDISVTINGSGLVARQEPAPGTTVQQGMSVILELK